MGNLSNNNIPGARSHIILVVDNVETELKTTGIIPSKDAKIPYEAKEPVSITAVQPETICSEEFEKSAFWEKTAHMLFAYYFYSH